MSKRKHLPISDSLQTIQDVWHNTPAIGLWAPGSYLHACTSCSKHFIGDKRAMECTTCATTGYLNNQKMRDAGIKRKANDVIDRNAKSLCDRCKRMGRPDKYFGTHYYHSEGKDAYLCDASDMYELLGTICNDIPI